FLRGSAVFALSFLCLALTRSIPLIALIYIINGAAWTCASISATAIVQKTVSNEVRGRVMSLFMLSGAIAHLNSLVLGLSADALGLELMMILTTGVCALLTLALIYFVPLLKKIDTL
ncbi:MAG: MFS transporter, partial [Gammaproteobacteria bacterium]|nr:MFS transporter [Gammaproteobacteria bacterium]